MTSEIGSSAEAADVPRLAFVAKAHGMFNVLGGLWPLVSVRSFESVTGPKADRWLVQTVAALMVGNGLAQLTAEATPAAQRTARALGVGTAVSLAGIDLVYAPRGRISKVYLVDAALELAWVAVWVAAGRSPRKPDARH